MFVFRKNRAIQAKIEAYLKVVAETLGCFLEGLEYYLDHGPDDHFHSLVLRTHDAEARADDLRGEIDREMFGQSLLPESREDLTRIIAHVDRIANQADDTLASIWTHGIVMPAALGPKLLELARVGVTAGTMLTDEVLDALGSTARVPELARRIDGQESIGDKLENEMVYALFHGDYDRVDRLLWRDVIFWVGSIADLATRVSDELTVFAVKRQV